MKYLLYLLGLFCFSLTSCDNAKDEPESGPNELPFEEEQQSYSGHDTLYYHAESNPEGEEGYTQTLKVVYKSDSIIWFNITYENMMAGGKVGGMAIDKHSSFGLESFEYNNISHPAREYVYQDKGFSYSILIDMQDSSLAKLNISSDIPTDAIPLQIVMKRQQGH